MIEMKKREKSGSRRSPHAVIALILLFVALGLSLMVYIYSSRYYRAGEKAQTVGEELLSDGKMVWKGDYAVLTPEKKTANGDGIIFYPGGLVQAEAYLPLLEEFREEGYTCVLLRMPFHLAVFDMQGAEAILPNLSGYHVDRWFLSGHSLGGVAADVCYHAHPGDFSGMLLYGSYVTEKTSDPKAALVLYGSEDHVLNRSRVSKENSTVEVIEGGNHGQFGDYGHQAGDGTAEISPEEQWQETAERTDAFIEKMDGTN